MNRRFYITSTLAESHPVSTTLGSSAGEAAVLARREKGKARVLTKAKRKANGNILYK